MGRAGQRKLAPRERKAGWVPHAALEPRTTAGREFPERKPRTLLPHGPSAP